MKKFLWCLALLLPLGLLAQSVAIVGVNNYSSTPPGGSSPLRDGYAFVALEDIPDGTKIFFTEQDYSGGSFSNNTEAVVEWTASGTLTQGCVVVIHEVSSNNPQVVDFSPGCNGGSITADFGSFSLGTSDPVYAFASTGSGSSSSIVTGVTEIYSAAYIDNANFPASLDPSGTFPDAIVWAVLGDNAAEFKPGLRASTTDINDILVDTNHDSSDNVGFDPLDNTPFIVIGGGNCDNSGGDTDGDGTCDDQDGCPNDASKIAPGTCGCGNPEPGAPCNDGDPCTANDMVQPDCSCSGVDTGTPEIAMVGVNNLNSSGTRDGFAFVALEDIPSGTKIFFTENDYIAANDAFVVGSEAVTEWTASGILAQGCVVVIHETSSNAPTVEASSPGCNGGSVTADFGSFSIGSTDPIYAFSSSGSGSSGSILGGLTEMFSVMYLNGTIPAANDPSLDFANAIVINVNAGSGAAEFMPGLRPAGATTADFFDASNYNTVTGVALDVLSATMFGTITENSCCGIGDDDNDGTCNDLDGCPNDPNKIDPGICGCGVADADSDGDGALDCNDGCPNDAAKTAPGMCGCGVADTDSDGDGTADCNDGCPNDAAKTDPGICGCGVADTDSDGDGTANCNDGCPNDATKTAPGDCGCGVADTDSDGDGTADCNDACPNDAAKTDPGICGCGVADTDSDGDGTADCNDGCPNDATKTTPGDCGCGVADTDSDGDGTADCNDACPNDAAKTDPGICGCGVADTDSDGDGTADCNDACPNDDTKTAPGDCGCGVADTDSDGDGTADCNDGCPNDPNKIALGTCGCGNPEPGTPCDDGDDCTSNDIIQADCSCAGTLDDSTPPMVNCPADVNLTADQNCQAQVPNLLTQTGDVVGDAVGEFSGVQGQAGWQYGRYFAFDANNFIPNNFDVGNNFYPGPQAFGTPFLDQFGGHPGIDNLMWAVRRWTSDYSGMINIVGEFFDRDLSCGDGAHVRILLNGTEVFQFLNVPPASTPYSLNLNVAIGDQLDFVIDPKFDAGCDNTQFTALITATAGVTTSDNCGAVSLSQSPTAGTTIAAGTTMVTITATDQAGNTNTCTVDVIVVDGTPPTVTCPTSAIPESAGTNCMFSIPDYSGLISASDACGGTVSLSQSPSIGSMVSLGTTSITVTGTDAAGNQSSCSFDIEVSDNTAPTPVCQAATIQVDASGNASLTAADVDGGSTDNCGITNRSVNIMAFDCSDVGVAQMVTLTLEDAAGNTSSCMAAVTVEDNIAPTIDCSAIDVTHDNDAGQCGFTMPGTGFDPTFADNCPGASISNDFNNSSSLAGETFPVGTTTVVWTVTDAAGNTASCTINIVVTDTEAPTIDCSAIDVTRDNDAGQCSFTMPGTGFDPSFADNCPGASISNDFNNSSSLAGETFPVGTTTVVWTATDAAGSTASCTIDIVVSDIEAPTIDCSAIDVTRDNDAGQCSFTMPGTGFDPSFADNCPGATISNDFNNSSSLAGETFPVGTTTVVWTATDVAGNSASCTIDIVISDTEAPTIDCSAIDVTRDNDAGQCSFTMPGTGFDPSFADNCPGATISNDFNNSSSLAGETFPVGTTTVVWTVTDAAGSTASCTINIVISDNDAPTIDCSGINSIRDNRPGVCGFTMPGTAFDPSFADNCSGAFILNNYNGMSSLFGEGFPIGTTNVVWTVFDAAGNTANCTISIVVTDVENPTINCSGIDPILESTVGQCGHTVSGTGLDPTFADNCPGSSISNDYNNMSSLAGASFPIGTTTVVWTVTDPSGNTASCSIDVEVTDTEAPMIDCSAIDVTQDNDAGQCGFTMPGTGFDPSFSDNCPGATVSNDFNNSSSLAGETFPVGTTTVVWTATDAAGNTASCTIDIVISDVEAPTIDCSAIDVTRDNDAGQCSFTMPGTGFDPTFADNCPGATISNDFNEGSSLAGETFPVGTTTVEWTVIDAAGNMASCTIDIVVSDVEPPTADCQDVTIVIGPDGTAPFNVFIAGAISNRADNCGLVGGVGVTGPTFYTCDQLGDVQVTIFNRDINDNVTTCTVTVTITDPNNVCNDPPVAVCQDVTVDANANCQGMAVAADFDGGSTDPDNDALSFSVDPVGPYAEGETMVTLTVSDGELTDQCTAKITVVDNTPPVINCPADITVSNDPGECTAVVTYNVTASDNCTGFGLSSSPASGFAFPVGVTTVTASASDIPNGNTASCSFTVTVNDTEAPVAPAAPQDLNLACANEVPAAAMLTATDNCAGNITVSPTEQMINGVCENDFTLIRTWTFTDASNNSSSISQTITVLDTLAPVLPGNLPQNLNLACADEVPDAVDITATDNCSGAITVSPTEQTITGVCENDFTLIRTWTFSDICGNTSIFSQTITVLDTLAPVLPGNLPQNLNLACADEVPDAVDITATDNCSGAITVSPTEQTITGVCENDFTLIRTWTFSDICGNTSIFSQTITVLDTLAPVLPGNLPQNLNLSCADEVPDAVDVTATDNCNGPITVSPTEQTIPGSSANDFTLIRTWTFSDICGNTSIFSQTIVVADVTPPTIDCSAIDVTRDNDQGECSFTMPGTGFDPTFDDNCVGATISNDFNNSSSLAGETFPVGTTTVLWTATDVAGNTASCTIDIVISDTEAPTIDCSAIDVTRDSDPGVCSFTMPGTGFDPSFADNCPEASISNDFNNSSSLAGETFPVGTTTVVWTVTDAAGNTASCTIVIDIADTEPPMINTCEASPINFNGEESFPSEDFILLDATDNCDIQEVTYSPSVITCEQLGEIVPVTVVVTDIYGNSSTCITNIEVGGLPCGAMTYEDHISCPGSSASYDVSNDIFTLTSTNCYYGSPFNSDEAAYVKYELCGDGEIVTQVLSVQPFGWAGLVMREGPAAGAKKFSLAYNGSNFARREVRSQTNGFAFPQQFPSFGKNWLRLSRLGNQFRGYVSTNGIFWQLVMVANIQMDQCIEAGLFVTNYTPNSTVVAQFGNVSTDASAINLVDLGGVDNLKESPDSPQVNAFPNPTAGQLWVELAGFQNQETLLEVTDAQGRVIRRQDLGEVQFLQQQVDLGNVPSGVYWLRVSNADHDPIVKRIVVQRP